VLEMRIDYGPGYRVYFIRRGEALVILVAGGDMRLQLDFAAQMLGHFFEGRDKIIADARTLGARSALGEPIAFPALSFQLNGSTAAISWRFVWQRHC